LKQVIHFDASPADIFTCLTDPNKIAVWGRCTLRVDDNGISTLFDGNVEYKVIEAVPEKKIIWRWRFKSWPADMYSVANISLELDSSSSGMNLSLLQTGVPASELDRLDANWRQYYWIPIKTIFGYGTDF
jgi:activator of HSP90 ATPase